MEDKLTPENLGDAIREVAMGTAAANNVDLASVRTTQPNPLMERIGALRGRYDDASKKGGLPLRLFDNVWSALEPLTNKIKSGPAKRDRRLNAILIKVVDSMNLLQQRANQGGFIGDANQGMQSVISGRSVRREDTDDLEERATRGTRLPDRPLGTADTKTLKRAAAIIGNWDQELESKLLSIVKNQPKS